MRKIQQKHAGVFGARTVKVSSGSVGSEAMVGAQRN